MAKDAPNKPGAAKLAAIEEGLTSMRADLARLEGAVAGLDLSALKIEFDARFDKIETLLEGLRADVPRMTAQLQHPLTADEVEALLAKNPGQTFISLCSFGGVRPGQPFEVRAKFDPHKFMSFVRNGQLRVARAA